MFSFVKKLFGFDNTPVAAPVVNAKVDAANSAPYKVPQPAAFTIIPLVAEVAPKKKPASKKQPVAKKTPAKKAGRKPKAKSAQ